MKKELVIKLLALFTVIGVLIYALSVFQQKEIKEATSNFTVYINETPLKQIEYGSEYIHTKDLINYIKGGTLKIVEPEIITTDKIFEGNITYTFLVNESEKTVIVPFVIKDTRKPVITIKDKQLNITQGDKIDLLDNVSAIDLVDGKLSVQLDDNNFDSNKAGTYQIKVSVTDKHNNRSEDNFTVIVNQKKIVNQVTPPKVEKPVEEVKPNKYVPPKPALPSPNNPSPTTPSDDVKNLYRKNDYFILKDFYTYLNDYRKSLNLNTLIIDTSLEHSSMNWSKYMMNNNIFEHSTGDYGEIIARVVPYDPIAKRAFDAWKASPSHNEVMIDKNLTKVGAICYQDPRKIIKIPATTGEYFRYWYCTAQFT